MGCGVWIKMSHSERIHICWNAGPGSNTMAKLLALWSGLLAGYNLGIMNVSIYGDSKVIIGVVNDTFSLSAPSAQGWMLRIKHLWAIMNFPPISHIFRELNTRVDGLSKKGLSMEFGFMNVIQYRDGVRVWATNIPIP